ncbi:MAG: RNA polymerase factor sigma-54 [Bacteroidales bacterium]|nr:RNA polymerase factor sigma-54 [Bacteroidales bacterium]
MLNQRLQQKLLQKLSPQQIQLMKLLQIPTISLEQRIKQEIEENPALEEGEEEKEEQSDTDEFSDLEGEENAPEENTEAEKDEFNLSDYVDEDEIPNYKTSVSNVSADDEKKETPFASAISFQENLLSQLGLRNLDERKHLIAETIIGNIDDSGYLQRELSAIVNDLAFSQNITTNVKELEELLRIINDFEPSGVGARNLQECLLIQLERKEERTKKTKTAIQIIKKCFEEFTKKHYEKIVKKLDITDEELKESINEILKLSPKPGDSFDSQKTIQYVIPDFSIFNNNGKLELTLNSKNAPELRLSRAYTDMANEYNNTKNKNSEKAKETLMFVKQKIEAAKWFIDAVKQRQNTLCNTMEAIMNYQHEYFIDGDETKLKPMVLKDIADIVNYDISTISRVVNSKYVQTNFGTIFLKNLFSESLHTDSGEDVSTKEVKKILRDCIEVESKKKPLTDDKLTTILKEKGYNIARRTVAKYREQLNIPVARMRKEL